MVVLASISLEIWCWRNGILQTAVKRLFPFGGYLRPGNPGVDAWSVGLSAAAPTLISPLLQTLQRPELAGHFMIMSHKESFDLFQLNT